ncbi:hypothetical protein [Flavobacterium nackdongense]|uniref:Uncharacterized protein n=1 Tax=Flavobacterium nackdongense TaxID=2547394 RepID=A0A4P6Y5C7_9FLAO|nr:hypothetical protein [Flavobacterium nackdongense]QBN17301.1 hypothetical protein E1750_00265 [Flavobacterium nackdongense]
MKKNAPNQFVSFKNNLNSVQQKGSLALKRVIFLLLFSLSIVHISAQSRNTVTPNVLDVNSYIASLKVNSSSNLKTKSNISTAQYVENLVFGIQPAVYYQSGIIKNYGENPVKLFTDVSSIKSMINDNFSRENIEIVVIKIDNTFDVNSKIDLLNFANLSKLKYIYILSTVNTTDAVVANMFLNYANQYGIFYKIQFSE